MDYGYEPEGISELLRIFGRSEIRIRILLALGGSEVKIGKLGEELNLTTSNIIHAIKALEDSDIVEKEGEMYNLTNIGYVFFSCINEIIRAITTLSKNKRFWLSHDISGIPNHLRKGIGVLDNCEVIESTPDDVTRAHSNFNRLVSQARDMKGISPIYCKDFYYLVKALVLNKANVELILTEIVLDKVLKEAEEERHILEEAYSEGHLRLLKIADDVKVGFTITDSIISLGFFDRDGGYDMANDLVGYDEGALEWGMQLYEYYRNQAVEVRL